MLPQSVIGQRPAGRNLLLVPHVQPRLLSLALLLMFLVQVYLFSVTASSSVRVVKLSLRLRTDSR